MNIVAVNGSHRKGKNTATLLREVLAEAKKHGASTELLELSDYSLKYCLSCNKCLRKNQCVITDDDMGTVAEKLLAADGIVLGSPVYWGNVSALMKNFMDRTRYLHMYSNMLAGKVGASVTNAGLRNGGQDLALKIMDGFLTSQGLFVVDARDHSQPLQFTGVAGSLQEGYKDGQIVWRKSVAEDEGAMAACRALGENLAKTIKKLGR